MIIPDVVLTNRDDNLQWMLSIKVAPLLWSRPVGNVIFDKNNMLTLYREKSQKCVSSLIFRIFISKSPQIKASEFFRSKSHKTYSSSSLKSVMFAVLLLSLDGLYRFPTMISFLMLTMFKFKKQSTQNIWTIYLFNHRCCIYVVYVCVKPPCELDEAFV